MINYVRFNVALVLIFLVSCNSKDKIMVNIQSNKMPKNAKTNSIWSYSDRLSYYENYQDSSSWDLELLKEELEDYKDSTWPTKPAISDYPSPVPKYDWGYCALYNLKLEIAGKFLKGACVTNAKDKYRMISDSTDKFIVKFNILCLTDFMDSKESAKSAISRNYPHYMSTGKQKTKQGDIDWVQMDMADGRNFAIINQRYFDLEFGRTIVVIPQKDGSLRFLQLDASIEYFPKILTDEIIEMKLGKYYEKLRKNEKLVRLLKSENTIEQTNE